MPLRKSAAAIKKMNEDGQQAQLVDATRIKNQLPPAAIPPATASSRGGVLLSDANPAALGTAAPGTGSTASRGDHVHVHGNQAGGSLHPDATTSVAGFQSAADKIKEDAYPAISGLTTGHVLTATGATSIAFQAPSGGGSAPTTATYITQTPDGTLSAEQALSALATGILKSTTTTGVLSIAAGADLPTMVASGASHSGGAAPDPGASSGTTKFLREDASWQVPPGASLTVEEVDGSPTDSAVTKIKFPNGTLAIASHEATYTPASALDLSQLLALDPANAEIDGSNIVTKWPSTNANGLSMRGVVGSAGRPLYVASVWNSQPVIRYDGSDDYTVTTLPGVFAPSFTFIVVCAPKNTTTKGMLEWSGGILNGTPHVYFQRNSTNVRVYTDANYQWTIAHTTDTPRVYCLVYDGGGLYTLSVDGSAQTDYDGSASGYPTDMVAAKALFLGSGASGLGNVDFGDVQLYNRALSSSEQSSIVTALKTKYGI